MRAKTQFKLEEAEQEAEKSMVQEKSNGENYAKVLDQMVKLKAEMLTKM